MVHEIIRESGKLCFLRHIDIKLFIIQPVVGVDADIALFVGINDKSVRRIFVPVSLQDLGAAVINGLAAAGKIGDGWKHNDRVCLLYTSVSSSAACTDEKLLKP